MAKTDKHRLNIAYCDIAFARTVPANERANCSSLRQCETAHAHSSCRAKQPRRPKGGWRRFIKQHEQVNDLTKKKWLPEREKMRLWIVSCVAVWRVTRAEAVVVGRGHHWRCCRRRWCCSWRSSACDFRSPTHSRSRHSDCWTSRRRRDTGWLRSRRRCRWSSATTWRQQSATWATVERRVRRHHLSLHRTEINVNGQAMGARWFLPPGRGKVSWRRPSNRLHVPSLQ